MSEFSQMRSAHWKPIGIPRLRVKNSGMQSSDLVAYEGHPAWQMLASQHNHENEEFGKLEITTEMMLEIVRYGEAYGDEFCMRMGEAFLRLHDTEAQDLDQAS